MGRHWVRAGVAVAVALGQAGYAHAATARREVAGTLADGTVIEAIVLTARNEVSARVLTYGATLQSLVAPDRAGRLADIVLGHDTAAEYVARRSYFGVTVGRYANRIDGGRFRLDGRVYQLSRNDEDNSLHGGSDGFDKRNWRVVAIRSGPRASVTLALTSPDGDQGYPGKLDVQVTYSLDEAGALTISFEAATDRSTIVNLTNHAIFNLAGEGAARSALGHRLTIPARAYTPVNERLIPTGKLQPVRGTLFDFTRPRTLEQGAKDSRDPQIAFGHGYDHNFALDKGLTATPQLAARLEDSGSGRVLEVLSTEPGIQLYTGNFLDDAVPGKCGHRYRKGDGVALEPQKFPDAPNHPGFVSARVDPVRPYRHVMIYRVSTTR